MSDLTVSDFLKLGDDQVKADLKKYAKVIQAKNIDALETKAAQSKARADNILALAHTEAEAVIKEAAAEAKKKRDAAKAAMDKTRAALDEKEASLKRLDADLAEKAKVLEARAAEVREKEAKIAEKIGAANRKAERSDQRLKILSEAVKEAGKVK